MLYGINDSDICGPGTFKLNGKQYLIPEYDMWKSMIRRCFSEKEQARRPMSKTPICSDEWTYRSNFQHWYLSQPSYYDHQGVKLQLDKDLLYFNNFLYSKDTCVLIPNYLNILFKKSSRTEIPWVYKKGKSQNMVNELRNPYRASVYHQGKHIELGFFSSALEGHLAAQLVKIDCIQKTKLRYASEEAYVNPIVVSRLDAICDHILQHHNRGKVFNLL